MDGTICETRKDGEKYDEVKPKPGAVDTLRQLRLDGHYIIIYSSRHMATCNNNLGKITAIQAPVFEKWFKKHKIEYDELWFGKPLADIYIDDKTIPYENNWGDIYNKLKTI